MLDGSCTCTEKKTSTFISQSEAGRAGDGDLPAAKSKHLRQLEPTEHGQLSAVIHSGWQHYPDVQQPPQLAHESGWYLEETTS